MVSFTHVAIVISLSAACSDLSGPWLSVRRPIAASASFWVYGSSRSCFTLLLCGFPFLWTTRFTSLSNHLAHSVQYHLPKSGKSSDAFVALYWAKCFGERRSALIWSRSLVFRRVLDNVRLLVTPIVGGVNVDNSGICELIWYGLSFRLFRRRMGSRRRSIQEISRTNHQSQ